MFLFPLQHCFCSPPGRMYIISPIKRSCVEKRKGYVSYELRELGGVAKELILRWGANQMIGSWGGRNFPPPPSVTFLSSTWMNVYYISKHKKLCSEDIGLCLLRIEGGRRG